MFLFAAQSVWADAGGEHEDPIAPALIALAVILVCARVGAHVATRFGQAAVLGELVAGVVLGNLKLLGAGDLGWMAADSTIDALSRLGVILLLFEVGLESTVGQMMRVGGSALLVAVLGVVTPFALGWGVGHLLLPEASVYAHAFLGATLAATSVGITARVLKDLGHAQSNEARIILGAAVIDDVLGLVVLAVITSLIHAADSGGSLSAVDTLLILGRALGFLVAALLGGVLLSRRVFRAAATLDTSGVLLALALALCFSLAWAANAIGLAPIVGAFAAGLILEEAHFVDFVGRGEKQLEEILHPITSFLVPVFFVVMGMRTDLRAFAAPGVMTLAIALTAVAVLGKQACALGVLGGAADRITVGLGMIPRGEVGLIFANIGLSLSIAGQPIINSPIFSGVVVMVIVTTMITPPLLKWSLARAARR
jgi:Kef-type K+ transport system membrane component KefB